MVATSKELYEKAMSLDPEERAELIGLLLESLDIGEDDDVEPAWLEEIEKRMEALDSGAVETVPWSEVRSRVFEPSAR